MKVILTTNIKKLGKIGDLVVVKDGYARNFLFPNGMALRENKKNIEHYEKIKDEIKAKEEMKLKEAQHVIDKVKTLKIVFNKEADEKDQLYGSISKREIINFLKDNNISIHPDDLEMKNVIRTLGEHEIKINPYIDISHNLTITVNKN